MYIHGDGVTYVEFKTLTWCKLIKAPQSYVEISFSVSLCLSLALALSLSLSRSLSLSHSLDEVNKNM